MGKGCGLLLGQIYEFRNESTVWISILQFQTKARHFNSKAYIETLMLPCYVKTTFIDNPTDFSTSWRTPERGQYPT